LFEFRTDNKKFVSCSRCFRSSSDLAKSGRRTVKIVLQATSLVLAYWYDQMQPGMAQCVGVIALIQTSKFCNVQVGDNTQPTCFEQIQTKIKLNNY